MSSWNPYEPPRAVLATREENDGSSRGSVRFERSALGGPFLLRGQPGSSGLRAPGNYTWVSPPGFPGACCSPSSEACFLRQLGWRWGLSFIRLGRSWRGYWPSGQFAPSIPETSAVDIDGLFGWLFCSGSFGSLCRSREHSSIGSSHTNGPGSRHEQKRRRGTRLALSWPAQWRAGMEGLRLGRTKRTARRKRRAPLLTDTAERRRNARTAMPNDLIHDRGRGPGQKDARQLTEFQKMARRARSGCRLRTKCRQLDRKRSKRLEGVPDFLRSG